MSAFHPDFGVAHGGAEAKRCTPSHGKMHPISRRNAPHLTESPLGKPNKNGGETHIDFLNTIKTIKSYRRCRLLTRRLFSAFRDKPEERKSLKKGNREEYRTLKVLRNDMSKRLGFYRLSARMALKGAETGLGRLGGIKASIYTLQVARSLRGVFAPLARGITNKEEI